VLASAALRAVDRAPEPSATPPIIIPLNGEPAVVTKVPPELPRGEVRELAAQQEQTAEQVASGEVPIAKATRDLSQAPDPGSSIVFWLLAALFGGVVRPPVDYIVERSRLDDRLGGAVHVAALAGFYLLLWAVLHGSHPGMPQDWESWLIAAGLGGGAGAGAQSALRSTQGRSTPPPGARDAQEGRT